MELENGYKQTEIGVIPSDWHVLNLGKSSTLKARIGWQGLTTAEYLTSGDYFLITGTDFKDGYIDWDNCVYVEKERYVQDKNIQVKIDDILVTKDGTIGKVAFVDKVPKETTLNSGVFVVRPINKFYNSRYLYYILMSEYFKEFLNRLTAGSTISHLYQKDFIFFDFPKPTLKEQTDIATVLSDTDTWISTLEQLLAKKRQIKQGAMQELLQPKEGWEEVNIESLSKIFTKQTGFDYSSYIKPSLIKKKDNTSIPFIQNKDFKNKWINFDTDYYIPIDVATKFPRILLNERCLLISISGSVGNVGVFCNSKMAFVGGAVAVVKFKNIDALDWVMYYLLSDRGQNTLLSNVKSGSHKNLILEDIRKIKIPMPSNEEQKKLTSILGDMDLEIIKLEIKLTKAEQIKKGMMQELLTGRIRLVKNEGENI